MFGRLISFLLFSIQVWLRFSIVHMSVFQLFWPPSLSVLFCAEHFGWHSLWAFSSIFRMAYSLSFLCWILRGVLWAFCSAFRMAYSLSFLKCILIRVLFEDSWLHLGQHNGWAFLGAFQVAYFLNLLGYVAWLLSLLSKSKTTVYHFWWYQTVIFLRVIGHHVKPKFIHIKSF